MKRRSFVQGAAAAALGVPHLAGLAQQSVTLKFHTFMQPMSNVWLSMHKPWMDKVEKESGGRIKFEAYPAMQLGGTPVQLYDQAKDALSTSSGRCRATPRAASRAWRFSSCRS
jgi:TRAP-type C4-dicarboxylate transport system substrate-binding protein